MAAPRHHGSAVAALDVLAVTSSASIADGVAERRQFDRDAARRGRNGWAIAGERVESARPRLDADVLPHRRGRGVEQQQHLAPGGRLEPRYSEQAGLVLR